MFLWIIINTSNFSIQEANLKINEYLNYFATSKKLEFSKNIFFMKCIKNSIYYHRHNASISVNKKTLQIVNCN